MENAQKFLEQLKRFMEVPIFELGNAQITLGILAYLILAIAVLFYLSGVLRVWMAERLLPRRRLDLGARLAVAAISRYIVLLIGVLVIIQTAGINLTTLNVVVGAIGIGAGFGLQNVVSNFISGLIIMFERPIKIGDRIVVDEVEGDVVEIGARSTKVLTNDNITIIVPNSKFITENVVNWKYNDARVRFRIPVSVAYGSDVRLVEKLLLEVAGKEGEVLEDPAPAVRFLEFGENGLAFELRAWTTSLVHRKGRLISMLNFAIYEEFRAHEIEIPFPQCDLRIRGGTLEVKTVA